MCLNTINHVISIQLLGVSFVQMSYAPGFAPHSYRLHLQRLFFPTGVPLTCCQCSFSHGNFHSAHFEQQTWISYTTGWWYTYPSEQYLTVGVPIPHKWGKKCQTINQMNTTQIWRFSYMWFILLVKNNTIPSIVARWWWNWKNKYWLCSTRHHTPKAMDHLGRMLFWWINTSGKCPKVLGIQCMTLNHHLIVVLKRLDLQDLW